MKQRILQKLAGHLSFSANEGNGVQIDSIPQKSKKAWKQMRFLQFVCVLAMACFPLMSMAFADHNRYSQVTATVSPTGAGKVYVAKSKTENRDYQETHLAQTKTDRSVEDHTYYLYAQAETDFAFSGWYQGSSFESSDNPYTRTVKGSEGELAEYTFFAVFTRITPRITTNMDQLEIEAWPK